MIKWLFNQKMRGRRRGGRRGGMRSDAVKLEPIKWPPSNTETADEDSKEFIKYIYDSGLISKSPEEIGEFPKAYGSRKVENSTQVTICKTKDCGRNLNHEQLVKQSGNVSDRISGIKNYYKKYVPVEVMKQVYEYYYWDFELFGYGIDEYYVSWPGFQRKGNFTYFFVHGYLLQYVKNKWNFATASVSF